MKSRFCPSPTGYVHLGNVRTALFNVLIAKHFQGHFVVRIEDTDKARSEHTYTEALLSDLKWLELEWQEGPEIGGENGPYWQSQRQSIYDRYYTELEQQGHAYPCFCSDEQLALNRKIQLSSGQPPRYPGTCRYLNAEQIQQRLEQGIKPTLRFKIPAGEQIEFDDLVRGKQIFNSDDIGDFIIRRADGTASFMFCNIIDDALMGITHALRGEDHLANTPRQLLISRVLNLTPPTYGHLPLITGYDGSPLSKRNGSRSIKELRNEGYWPVAINNYLARLGHHYANNELMSLTQLAQLFTTDALQKAPARYDEQQLRYWQKEATMQMPDEIVWQAIESHVAGLVPQHLKITFTQLIKPNILFPHEAEQWANAFFADHLEYSHDAKHELKTAGVDYFEKALQGLHAHGTDFKALCQYLTQMQGVKGKALFMPLRIALTGELHGPELAGVLNILGEEGARKRFEQAIFAI